MWLTCVTLFTFLASTNIAMTAISNRRNSAIATEDPIIALVMEDEVVIGTLAMPVVEAVVEV